jgi:mono/diheme cytochrome c family protein
LRTILIRSRRRASRAAGIVAIALCAGACSSPAAERPRVDAPALFAQACAKCHASDGTGGLPSVPNGPRPIDLTSPEWHQARSDEEIAAAIRSGRGAMPPFEGVLTSEQVAALTAYVRALKRR